MVGAMQVGTRQCSEQIFEKAGWVYLGIVSGNNYLTIWSDRTTTQYMMRRSDLNAVIQNPGVSRTVRRDTGSASGGAFLSGNARLSTSRMALNITIGEPIYTVPMKSLNRVLAGANRKAPLFVPVERVTYI